MINFNIVNGVLMGVTYLGNETVLNIPGEVKIIKKIKIDQDIKEIIIPSSVEKIELGAFLHGEKINKITLIDNQNFIVKNKLLFDKNKATVYLAERDITGNVELPNTVKIINDHTFNNCAKLTSIRMSDNVKYIGAFAFIGCTKLTSIQLPKVNSLELKESAFENCWSLKKITIPKNVVGFGPCLFFDCHKLEKVEIETEKLELIPFKCFMLCERLLRLDFNNGIKTIEDKAFLGCSNITEMTLPNTVAHLAGDHIFDRDDNLIVFTSSKALKTYCDNHGVICLNDVI